MVFSKWQSLLSSALCGSLIFFTVGCSAFLNSFKDGPEYRPLAPTRTNMAMDGTYVRVTVYDDNRAGWCVRDISDGLDCTFGFERLKSDAKLTGGWYALIPGDARTLCDRAMFTALSMDAYGRVSHGRPEWTQACAFGLLELRFRELAPPTNDRNQ
jgi:hypothetical protein